MQLTKSGLDIKRWALVLVPVLILLLWDFGSRLYIGTDASLRQGKLPSLTKVLNLLVSEQVQNDVLRLYADYDIPVPITPKVEPGKVELNDKELGLSEEEQIAQSGLLDSFFSGDKQVHLAGIFWDQEYFAVLVQTNVKTDDVTEIQLKLDQELGHYIISNITKSQVKFTRESNTITLQMF